jgi:hypothetical protein
MKGVNAKLRLVFCFCVALAVLLAATQPLLSLFFIFLIPVWFFLALVVVATAPVVHNEYRALPALSLFLFSPRPPPAS